ncbi:MAG: DUF6615 family protein [Nostoc sp.]|uniref:DUF6615 family protein n=1 Tax=Nostoc sp. TaxID=1180 RepID=UPI002FF8181A
MENICQQIYHSSKYVSLWLTKQPHVNEESLTDWLLFHISTKVPNIHYHTFTRIEEARQTGADWEWWILFPQNYVRFRVQAKKLSTDDNYKKIAYANKYGLQIHKFLEDSKQANAISLYALYSPAINYEMCNKKLSNQNDGVFLAGGQQIHNAFILGYSLKITAIDILKLSRPFSCFACCPLITANGGGLQHYLKQYFQLEMTSVSPNYNNFRGLHDELPNYLSSFMDKVQVGVPEWWEKEFKLQMGDFNALLVYDFRPQSSDDEDIPF